MVPVDLGFLIIVSEFNKTTRLTFAPHNRIKSLATEIKEESLQGSYCWTSFGAKLQRSLFCFRSRRTWGVKKTNIISDFKVPG